jgi:hypothetical protein
MDYQVVLSLREVLIVLAFVGSNALCWFVGGYYKSRRVQVMTKDEIKEDAEARLKAHLNAVGKVLQAEIQKLKDKQ